MIDAFFRVQLPTLVAMMAVMCWTNGRDAGANAPAGRYTVPGDGTVMDNKTGLTWRQTEQSGTFTWATAPAQCTGGWRLPTIQELYTIVDKTRTSAPTIDTSVFYGATPGSLPTAGPVWTATPSALTAGGGWIVNFVTGNVYYTTTVPSTTNPVRCVR